MEWKLIWNWIVYHSRMPAVIFCIVITTIVLWQYLLGNPNIFSAILTSICAACYVGINAYLILNFDRR